MAQRRHVETHAHSVARTGARESWAQAHTQCGDHRQSVGENQPKRGLRGYDGGKKIKGRKGHVLVDTNGLIMQVLVHDVSIQDYNGGKLLLAPLRDYFPRLKLIWADSGYNKGGFVEWEKRDTWLGGRDHRTPLEWEALRLSTTGCRD